MTVCGSGGGAAQEEAFVIELAPAIKNDRRVMFSKPLFDLIRVSLQVKFAFVIRVERTLLASRHCFAGFIVNTIRKRALAFIIRS